VATREADPACPGCAELKALLTKALGEIARLQARVDELERRVKENSSNSHRPPSSDPPWLVKPKPALPKPTGRKPGGQPGHKGTTRDLLPPDQVDEIRMIRPEACRGCGARLGGTDARPWRHQVTDLPPVKPHVTEYQCHALECACGTVTRADLPQGVPSGAFGPRVKALVTLLVGAYRISRRSVEQLLHDGFGLEISLGSVAGFDAAISEALRAPVDEAREAVRLQPVAYVDETGWNERHKNAWLWAAVTAIATVFVVRKSRGSVAAKELLGEHFAGHLVSDRWSAYKCIPTAQRQVCWAHLLRDFRKISEVPGTASAIGASLVNLGEKLFHYWHRVRDGTLRRSSFAVYASRLRCEMRTLLKGGAACSDRKPAAMCRAMLAIESAIWTFVRVDGLDPTNNQAERALRPVVLWRNSSLGTQTPEGSLYAERVLTAVATLRQHGRNVLEYLTTTCRAAIVGESAPSLITPPVALALRVPA
jgi:transposase